MAEFDYGEYLFAWVAAARVQASLIIFLQGIWFFSAYDIVQLGVSNGTNNPAIARNNSLLLLSGVRINAIGYNVSTHVTVLLFKSVMRRRQCSTGQEKVEWVTSLAVHHVKENDRGRVLEVPQRLWSSPSPQKGYDSGGGVNKWSPRAKLRIDLSAIKKVIVSELDFSELEGLRVFKLRLHELEKTDIIIGGF